MEAKEKAVLVINGRRKNLFINLSDITRKVLFSSSAGRVRESGKRNRKYKKSPGTIINLAQALSEYILMKNILDINIILKNSPTLVIKNFLRELLARGVYISAVEIRIPYTFSKVRAKKLRRI